MTRADTWMPLYIGDYLADTMHLEAREHGAYLLLLMHYWRTGPLPDDDRALAGIARVDRKFWISDTGPIIRAFFTPVNGRLHQKRLDAERAAADENSAKKRANANKRWGKANADKPANDPDPDASGGADGDANAYANASGLDVQTICPPARALPSPSPSKKEGELRSLARSKPERAKACQADPEFSAFYAAYPRKKQPDDALTAWRKLMRRGVKPSTIMAALARHQFKPDLEFVPYPASWLNAGAWKDEPDPTITSGGTVQRTATGRPTWAYSPGGL